ncbi:MAG: twin-arginine translocase TatA/TatE family subunit [Actinomycetota bacterium]
MLNIGPPELLLVLVIALVVVGPNRLPELARTIGRGLSEFRKVQDEVKDMVKFDLSMDPVTAPTPRPSTPHRTARPATRTPDPAVEPAPHDSGKAGPEVASSEAPGPAGDADQILPTPEPPALAE